MPPKRRQPSSSPATPESSASKLVCTAGPKAGEEYPLDGAEVVIGREVDNAVSIPDTSVSRKHAVLKRVGAGWAVSDLGSGNGTQVNGETVQDETALHNGDTITCGDTELTFSNTGNTTERRPVPRRTTSSPDSPVRRAPTASRPRASRLAAADPEKKKRKRRLLLLTTVFVLLVAASMAAIKYKQFVTGVATHRKELEDDEFRRRIGAIFQEGKNLARAGNWDEAKVKFEEIEKVAPAYPGVQDYLEHAQKEIPNQQTLAAAEKAIEANQVAQGLAELNKVSADTQQFEQVRKLRARIDALQLERVQAAEQMAQSAERAAQANKQDGVDQYKQVLAVVEDLLAANPDNRDAKVLKDNADQRIAALTHVDLPPPPPPAEPWKAVMQRFVDGDLTGAFAMADACAVKFKKCAEKRDLMRQFSEKYKGLEDLDAKGLTVLLDLNEKITEGQPSKFSKNAGTRAASIFLKSAFAAKAAGQYGRALEHAQRAVKADPGNASAIGIIADIRSKAKEVFLQAYAQKDTEPEDAAAKFKEVMAMAPESDEYHQKAKYWLAQIAK